MAEYKKDGLTKKQFIKKWVDYELGQMKYCSDLYHNNYYNDSNEFILKMFEDTIKHLKMTKEYLLDLFEEHISTFAQMVDAVYPKGWPQDAIVMEFKADYANLKNRR